MHIYAMILIVWQQKEEPLGVTIQGKRAPGHHDKEKKTELLMDGLLPVFVCVYWYKKQN